MWRKNTITLIGCALMMWAWVDEAGTLQLSFSPDDAAPSETAVEIPVGTKGLRELTEPECGALKKELRKLRERTKKTL